MKAFAAFVVPGLVLVGLPVASYAQTATPQTSVSGGDKSLSSKLNESNGVITPKNDVDPGIHVPAPDPHPNSTPVVPPAATGGGSAK